jgi:hypothetical protein
MQGDVRPCGQSSFWAAYAHISESTSTVPYSQPIHHPTLFKIHKMAPQHTVDVEAQNMLELIKCTTSLPIQQPQLSPVNYLEPNRESSNALAPANARALHGRHLTYDILTSHPAFPTTSPYPDYTNVSVHVFLVGYDGDDKARVLKGAVSVGRKNAAPSASIALRHLWELLKIDLAAFTGEFSSSLGRGWG